VPEQQTTLEGMNLSFQLGIAYEKASQGQNMTEYNALVDVYNAWIRQNFGEDANLFKQKMNETMPFEVSVETNETSPSAPSTETNATLPVAVSSETSDNRSLPVSPGPLAEGRELKNPFKPGSELSQFGKKQVYDFG
jgi:hypothetical protein